jgi:hypothetical protein
MSNCWYLGFKITKPHIDVRIKADDYYQRYVSFCENHSDLQWIEDSNSRIKQAFERQLLEEGRYLFKTTAIFDFDMSKTNPYGLSINFFNTRDILKVDLRSTRNAKVVNIVFDLAETLGIDVYDGRKKLLRSQFI